MLRPATTPSSPSPKPRATGAEGEARTFYVDREFDRNAVKLLPGEFFVSAEDIVLSTVLGSCVAACIWDRNARIGGMNHFMLPAEGAAGDAWAGASGRYGVFAMVQLINELLKRGAKKANLEAKVFGGGAVLRAITSLNIGERNAAFVLEFCRNEGLRVVAQDLLDVHPRRVAFFPATGRALSKKLAAADAAVAVFEQQYTAKINTAEVAGDIELF